MSPSTICRHQLMTMELRIRHRPMSPSAETRSVLKTFSFSAAKGTQREGVCKGPARSLHEAQTRRLDDVAVVGQLDLELRAVSGEDVLGEQDRRTVGPCR